MDDNEKEETEKKIKTLSNITTGIGVIGVTGSIVAGAAGAAAAAVGVGAAAAAIAAAAPAIALGIGVTSVVASGVSLYNLLWQKHKLKEMGK